MFIELKNLRFSDIIKKSKFYRMLFYIYLAQKSGISKSLFDVRPLKLF